MKLELVYNMLIIFSPLDDNGPQETEAQNDISGNWWFNLIAIKPEVAQSRNTIIDGVVHCLRSDRTDVGATYTCKYRKGINVIRLTIALQNPSLINNPIQ